MDQVVTLSSDSTRWNAQPLATQLERWSIRKYFKKFNYIELHSSSNLRHLLDFVEWPDVMLVKRTFELSKFIPVKSSTSVHVLSPCSNFLNIGPSFLIAFHMLTLMRGVIYSKENITKKNTLVDPNAVSPMAAIMPVSSSTASPSSWICSGVFGSTLGRAEDAELPFGGSTNRDLNQPWVPEIQIGLSNSPG